MLTVRGAARMLGVHPNTVRAWTDQGRLACSSINERGDRRYRPVDLRAFQADAGLVASPVAPFQSRRRSGATQVLHAGSRRGAREGADADSAASGGTGEASERGGAGPTALLAQLARVASAGGLDPMLRTTLRLLRDTRRFPMVAVGAWSGDRLVCRASEGSHRVRSWWPAMGDEAVLACRRDGRQRIVAVRGAAGGARGASRPDTTRILTPIGEGATSWGALVVELRASAPQAPEADDELRLLEGAAAILGMAVARYELAQEVAARDARQRALAIVTIDLTSPLEPSAIVGRLVDHAQRLLGGKRATVLLTGPDGNLMPEDARWSAIVAAADPSMGGPFYVAVRSGRGGGRAHGAA